MVFKGVITLKAGDSAGTLQKARFWMACCHDNLPRSEKTELECSKNAGLECCAGSS